MLELKTAEKYYCILVLKLNFSQKKICKFYSAFSKLHKIPKLSCIDQFMVLGLSIYLEEGKNLENIPFQHTHIMIVAKVS